MQIQEKIKEIYLGIANNKVMSISTNCKKEKIMELATEFLKTDLEKVIKNSFGEDANSTFYVNEYEQLLLNLTEAFEYALNCEFEAVVEEFLNKKESNNA